ncbi:ATP-dependent nuclease [Vibrio parahaemolyticus]|uniref:ATP-dependent nuclease n=1 Tax=Vibrio parahaemolyticus TaxID=670 RepID=UPI001E4F0881|nr:AAA family ATPase [Vibrio parahaemolyticus]HCE2124831.1 AAA family ATPase [Vibrio parahaemolyticus]
MYLEKVKLWNFRKYGKQGEIILDEPHLELNLNKGVNVLIGENDSGKTAIIDAIKLVLKTHSYEWIRPEEEDFFSGAEKMRIELYFDDMEEQAYHFNEWLSYREEGGKLYPTLKLVYEVISKDGRIIPSDICAGDKGLEKQLKSEAKEYLKTTYLKPLRDASSDLTPKQNSRLSQILKTHDAFKIKDGDHLLLALFKEFNANISNYFEGKDHNDDELTDDVKGRELKQKIDKFMSSFVDMNTKTSFEVSPANLKSILEKLSLKVDSTVNPGLGTLNKLFMAAELLHLDKDDWTGLKLCLIEELEAHLHPQAQMKVIEALQAQKGIQFILSSHSPNLTSKVKLENLILCHEGNVYPLGEKYTKLNKEEGDYLYLERFLDVTKSNMFFARSVMMVEGWSEEILLPALAKLMKNQGIIDKDFTEAGVAIVNVASAEFMKFRKIFLRNSGPELSIPVSIITDCDTRAYSREKVENEEKKISYNYIKLDEVDFNHKSEARTKIIEADYNDQNVKVFVTKYWTLEYSLQQSIVLQDVVKKVLVEMHPQINVESIEKELAIKLYNKSLCKTDFAYKLARYIDPDSLDHDKTLDLTTEDKYIRSLIQGVKYVCS